MPRSDAAAYWNVPPYTVLTGFWNEIDHPVEARYVRAMAETRLIRSLSEDSTIRLRISPEFLRFAIEQQIRATGREFDSLLDLVGAVVDLHSRMRELRVSSPADFVSMFMIQTENAHETQLERPAVNRPNPARFAHPEVGPPNVISSGIGETQRTSTADQVRTRSTEANVSSQDSGIGRSGSSSIMCKICNGEPACVMFLDCRHLAACSDCATPCERCPTCRATIREKMRLFVT